MKTGLKSGFSDERFFPYLKQFNGVIRFTEKQISESESKLEVISSVPVSEKLANLEIEEIVSMMQTGKHLIIYPAMDGRLTYEYLDFNSTPSKPLTSDPVASFVNTEKHIFITEPANGSTISGPSTGFTINIKGVAKSYLFRDNPHSHDPGVTEFPATDVKISFDNGPLTDVLRDPSGGFGNWSFVQNNVLGRGTKNITIRASATYAGLGKKEVAVSNINISFASPNDIAPPNVNITSPKEGSSFSGYSSGVQVDVVGTASDTDSGVKIVEVTIDNDLTQYKTATPKGSDDWSNWSYSLLIKTAGSHIKLQDVLINQVILSNIVFL